MWALSDKEINNYFRHSELFGGVYPKNAIPPRVALMERGAIIVNMNNVGQAGSHWTLVLMEKGHTVYLDSFGVVPSANVLRFVKSRSPKNFYVDRQLQDLASSSCGWFCIYFARECMLKGRDILDVLGEFTYDTKRNEALLKKRMQNM
jgi:hypothetical protein